MSEGILVSKIDDGELKKACKDIGVKLRDKENGSELKPKFQLVTEFIDKCDETSEEDAEDLNPETIDFYNDITKKGFPVNDEKEKKSEPEKEPEKEPEPEKEDLGEVEPEKKKPIIKDAKCLTPAEVVAIRKIIKGVALLQEAITSVPTVTYGIQDTPEIPKKAPKKSIADPEKTETTKPAPTEPEEEVNPISCFRKGSVGYKVCQKLVKFNFDISKTEKACKRADIPKRAVADALKRLADKGIEIS